MPAYFVTNERGYVSQIFMADGYDRIDSRIALDAARKCMNENANMGIKKGEVEMSLDTESRWILRPVRR